MNNVNLYQNYLQTYQKTGNTGKTNGPADNHSKRQTAGKPNGPSYGNNPSAVYERTTTDADIQKMQQKKQPPVKETPADKPEDTIENITIQQTQRESQLSDKAKAVLDQLREKYGNMDFFVGDVSNTEETQYYLKQGSKQYSVVIDPETLEQMANDEEAYKKYDDILAAAGQTFDQVKEELGEDAEAVTSLGMTIDKDGKISMFAELEKQSARMIEIQKKTREEQAENKKAAEKAKEKKEAQEKAAEKAEEKKDTEKTASIWETQKDGTQTTRVTGSNVEELVAAIRQALQA